MNRRRGVPVLNLLLTFTAVLSLSSCGPQASFTVDDCVCPGSTLRFNCTAVGAGITVWTGSAVPQGCQLNLQHTQFNDLIERGESRFCDDMSIVAKPLSVVGNCYNSQLNITSVGTDLNGRSIVCEHDMVGSTNNIGSYNIMLTTDPFLPPNNMSLTAITNGLTFSWENVALNCLSLSYGIDASGCGTCPSTTNSTSVTCSGIRLSGTAQTCNISVRAITCGNITGDYSEPLTTTLQAANAPSVTIIPVYSQNTSYLIAFRANIGEVTPVSISGNDVTVQSIQINYRTNGVPVCDSDFTQSCDNGMCSREINVMISSCTLDATSIVTVDVAATSVLGMGPAATLRIDGSIRNFVQVTPNIENTTITCEFPNQLDNSNKSCIVTYGRCGQQLSEMAQGSTTPEEPNGIQVELDLSESQATYCYIVRASNDTFTVLIEGNITIGGIESTTSPTDDRPSTSNVGAVVGGVVVVVIVLVAVGAIVGALLVFFVFVRPRKRKPVSTPEEQHYGESIKDTEAKQEADMTLQMTANKAYASTTQQTSTKETVAHSPATPAKDDERSSLLPAAVGSPQDEQMKEELFEKHQNQIPVSIERDESEVTLKDITKKFWMPQDWKMSTVEKKIRKLLELSNEQPLYLTVGNKTVVERASTLRNVYDTNKSEDNHLHVAYTSKKTADPTEL